jgi:hypothetical protein
MRDRPDIPTGVDRVSLPLGELSPSSWPDHTQLPDSDDNFVKNFQEHPQSVILTEPLLDKIHLDKDYCR